MMLGSELIQFGDEPYWSKKGSNMMTSSPGSMNAMKALSMPSFAPVVMVTSVFGLSSLPKNGE